MIKIKLKKHLSRALSYGIRRAGQINCLFFTLPVSLKIRRRKTFNMILDNILRIKDKLLCVSIIHTCLSKRDTHGPQKGEIVNISWVNCEKGYREWKLEESKRPT